jgi:hypothetical protein
MWARLFLLLVVAAFTNARITVPVLLTPVSRRLNARLP